MSVKVIFCPPNENNLREHEVDITLYMATENTVCVNICSCDSRFCNFFKNPFFINIALLGVNTCSCPLISCCHNSTLPKI